MSLGNAHIYILLLSYLSLLFYSCYIICYINCQFLKIKSTISFNKFSTIFKTFNSNIDSSIAKIGMFNKSFWAMKQDLAHGHGLGFSIFGGQGITKNDQQAILNLNNALKNGMKPAKAWATTMSNASISAQNMARNTLKADGSLSELANGLQVTTVKTRIATTSLKALSIAGNMLSFMAIAKVIQLTTNAIDNYVHRVEKANEAMDEAVSKYEETKSELEGISSELTENKKLIDELNAKDKLTYTEKGQLEELQEITKELMLQQKIGEKNAEHEAQEVATKTIEAYEKQYGKYNTSKEGIEERLSIADDYVGYTNKNDIAGLIASYTVANNELEKLRTEASQTMDSATQEEISNLESDIQNHVDSIAIFEKDIDTVISDLQNKQSNLREAYNNAINKQSSGEALTIDDQNIIATYEEIADSIRLIYEYTDQNTWNTVQIEDIFNSEGIEKTKDELVAMAQAGELTPETLKGFTNLNKAIEESEMFLQDGQTATQAFIEEINALVNEVENLQTVSENEYDPLSISESIDKLNTELKPSLDSLKDAWEDIFTEDGFTLKNVDTSMLDDIKSTIDELNDPDGLNLGIDYTAFEELSKVLTNTNSSAEDVKNSMNSFASSIFNSIDTTRLFDKETASVVETLLESMGVSNAHAIVTKELEAQTEALALQQQFTAQTGWELQDASNSSVEAFLNHAGASSVARTELFLLKLAQDDFANSDMNAKEKIEELQELATAYGQTAIAARIANLEKANTDGHIGIDYDKELASLMDYINNVNNVEVDYTPVTDKKSGKDSSKEFDWIETAINNIEKDIERLDKTIDSAYTSAGEKSEAFVEQLHKVNEEIKLQQQAYEGYMAKANSVGLSDNYKKLVQSGAINIETIKDEKLQKKIDEYSQWYEKAQETQDKINDLYEQSSDIHVESYEFEADQLAKLRDKNLLNVAEYYKSMTDLQDQYYNSEALKLKDLADKMEAEYGRMSNINFTRPTVDATAMQSAGYTPTVESSSVHAMTFGNGEKQVVVTPILPDGTILSPEALINYATQLLNGEQIDANIQLAMFDGKNAQKQANEYIKGLEGIQGEYAKLKETFEQNPYGDLTEKQLEAIEKLSEELGKIKDDLSSELGDIKSAYDNLLEIRDTYNKHGKISIDQYQNLCDMGFEYLALLSNESGALSLD